MNLKVSIIVLNWNGWKDTIECLESLYQITYPNYDVIVVDNGSKDDSVKKIKELAEGEIKVKSKFFEYSSSNKPIYIREYNRKEAEEGEDIMKDKHVLELPSNRKLRLILNEKNYGFAEGNNIGMRYALKFLNPDYVLLLNNDTVVDKEFLAELVKVAEGDKMIGIVGPKIYYYDFDGRRDIINFIGAHLKMWKGSEIRSGVTEIDRGQWNTLKTVDKIEGSCMLIKEEVFRKVGLMNTKYFAYWEDTDFCIRAKKKGYIVVCVPKAKIWHKEASTTRKTSGFYEYLMTRNMFWFMKQYATGRQYLLFLSYFFGFRFWVNCGIHLLYRRDIDAFTSFFKGVMDGMLDRRRET